MLPRIVKFAGVSAAGLALDYAIYALLCELGVTPGLANLVSASAGVTFVYLASARRVFRSQRPDLHRLFVLYAGYQVVAVVLASGAVEAVVSALDGAYLLGKTAVLPFSFTANFVFMSWLLGARRAGAVAR